MIDGGNVCARYAQDWGEQMVGKVSPVIVKLSLGSEQPVECGLVTGEATPDWSPGLVKQWAGGLVGVAYRTSPRKLGKVYCSNRPAVLFYIAPGSQQLTVLRDVDTEQEPGAEIGIEGVEVSPGGRVVWLERTLTKEMYPGPHR